MSTSTTTGAGFTGSSSFASDLAQVVARAVSFASLPMQQLQTEDATIQGQQSEVATLQSDFQSIQTALDSLDNSSGSSAYSASVDNTSVATASVSSGVFAGTYSVDVLNTGSQTNTMSNAGLTTVTDPTSGNIDSSTAFTLTVGNGTSTQTYNISDGAGTLNGLAEAINASGANVQATVVNIGSSSSPDYRLSVQGSDYEPATIQLGDSSNSSLLQNLSTGSYVQYQVNGASSTADSSSRSINLSAGLAVNIAATGTANITVSQTASGIENAISSFVSAYNAAYDEVQKSRGQGGGALTGSTVVDELSSALETINGYTSSSGNLTSLADVGVTVDENGHLDFDSSTFGQAAATSVSDVLNFFGSETGGGFLGSVSNILTGVNDPTTGTLTNFASSLTTQNTNLQSQISTDQDQVNTLQTNLTNQMSTADATISSMEQQLSYVTSLFSAEQANETASAG